MPGVILSPPKPRASRFEDDPPTFNSSAMGILPDGHASLLQNSAPKTPTPKTNPSEIV